MNTNIKTGPIMAALLISGFVGLFSETALNIALGDLSIIFDVNPTTIQWLATGYFLTLGILVPVTGILMQKFTTRQMFLTSILLSISGTIMAAVAPTFAILLAARVIQAAGLAIALPLTQNVIFTIFPPNKRGGAMGLMGLVMLAGPTLGPTLAGLIMDTLSWEWIFWVTLPFLVFALVFGLVYLRNVNEIRKVSIDVWSVILSTIGFGGIVYGVSIGGESGWTSLTVIGTIVIGLIALLIFVIRQTTMKHPMLNLIAFKYPLFAIGVIMSFITFFNMLSMLVILPMFMQLALLITAFVTGLILLPGSFLNCVLAPFLGRFFDKYGPRAVITPGTILVVIGYAMYTQSGIDTASWILVITHIIMMLGIGMVLAAVQTNTLNSLPKQYYPDGIALTQTVQQVAGAIGIAVMVSILSAKESSYLAVFADEATQAVASGATLVFKISLIFAVISFILSLFLKKPDLAKEKIKINDVYQSKANHYKSIVVAVDGSKEAEYAFRKSIDVARRNEGSILNIVNIIDTRSFETYDRSTIDQAQQRSEELLNGYKEQAEAEGIVNIKVVIEYGSPKTIITKELASLVDADLIMCGAKGLNAVERFLMGSVSEAIVRSAQCDVLVVRTPE